MRSVESTVEPVACVTVDPAGSRTLAEIAVALERGLPCEVAVGLSQQTVGDSGSDVALGEVAVFLALEKLSLTPNSPPSLRTLLSSMFAPTSPLKLALHWMNITKGCLKPSGGIPT